MPLTATDAYRSRRAQGPVLRAEPAAGRRHAPAAAAAAIAVTPGPGREPPPSAAFSLPPPSASFSRQHPGPLLRVHHQRRLQVRGQLGVRRQDLQ